MDTISQSIAWLHDAEIFNIAKLFNLTSVDWLPIRDQGIQLRDAVIGHLESAFEEAKRGIEACMYENGCNWMRDMLMNLSRDGWAALIIVFLVIVVFLWMVIFGGKSAKQSTTLEEDCCLSIFDLAKMSYIKENALEVMKLVEALHFDPNYHIPSNGMTLFLCACIGGNVRLVHYLLQRGANCRSKNHHGDTCLHLAVYSTSGIRFPTKRLVELLLRKGTSVNAQNNNGDTPLHIAAMKGDMQMIQLLRLYDANPSISTSSGILPIHIATNAGFMDAARLLVVDMAHVGDERQRLVPGSTPPKVNMGLLSPEKAHLVKSSRPRKKLELP